MAVAANADIYNVGTITWDVTSSTTGSFGILNVTGPNSIALS